MAAKLHHPRQHQQVPAPIPSSVLPSNPPHPSPQTHPPTHSPTPRSQPRGVYVIYYNTETNAAKACAGEMLGHVHEVWDYSHHCLRCEHPYFCRDEVSTQAREEGRGQNTQQVAAKTMSLPPSLIHRYIPPGAVPRAVDPNHVPDTAFSETVSSASAAPGSPHTLPGRPWVFLGDTRREVAHKSLVGQHVQEVSCFAMLTDGLVRGSDYVLVGGAWDTVSFQVCNQRG